MASHSQLVHSRILTDTGLAWQVLQKLASERNEARREESRQILLVIALSLPWPMKQAK